MAGGLIAAAARRQSTIDGDPAAARHLLDSLHGALAGRI
jgi:hypothetical protein